MNKEYKALAVLSARLAESVLMDWDKEEQVRLAKEVATKCHSIFNDKESRDFFALVKRMREAQIECEVVDMMVRTKKKEDISEEWMAQFAAVTCNVDFYEDKVDEYLKKMEE